MGAILGIASVAQVHNQTKKKEFKSLKNVNICNISFKLRIKSDFVFNS